MMNTKTDRDVFARKMALAEQLAAVTGISSIEALGLITMLGSDWPSLVREADNLVRARPHH
jgi:hypothetical protein